MQNAGAIAMTHRLLICSIGLGAALSGAVIGALAAGVAPTDAAKAEVGSCAAYSGLPRAPGSGNA
jgi:hypothetical protein